MSSVKRLTPRRTVFLLCDVQTRFRTFIHGFDFVVATASKMLKLAKILDVPVIVTEQNPRALGPTVPELQALTEPLGNLLLGTYDKTKFTMAIPPVVEQLEKHNLKSVVVFGIESHICVQQTVLDLLDLGYDVFVVADGISSTHKEEVPIAIERMRGAGAQITTSESAAFELQLDSSIPTFKAFSKLIKEEMENTDKSLKGLLDSKL